MDVFDVVILGAGSAAAAAVDPLRAAGLTVAVVSAGRVGGECSYVACIPSKAMLHSARVNAHIQTAKMAGARADLATTGDDVAEYRRAVARRDRLAHYRDDAKAAERLNELGATLIRGRGRITKPGVVQVGNEQIGYRDLLINTGSQPNIPQIEGLENADYWTSDVAISSVERPPSLVILGGSAVGCELAQVYARFGSVVTVAERSHHLLPKEDSSVAAVLAAVLKSDGITVMLDVSATRVQGWRSTHQSTAALHGGGREFARPARCGTPQPSRNHREEPDRSTGAIRRGGPAKRLRAVPRRHQQSKTGSGLAIRRGRTASANR